MAGESLALLPSPAVDAVCYELGLKYNDAMLAVGLQ